MLSWPPCEIWVAGLLLVSHLDWLKAVGSRATKLVGAESRLARHIRTFHKLLELYFDARSSRLTKEYTTLAHDERVLSELFYSEPKEG
jgi:hypothetical protein